MTKQRISQVVKVVIGTRHGGRRHRRRRRMVERELRTNANTEQSIPQAFSRPSVETGFNLFSKLAEQKKEALDKQEQGLTQRSILLDNRELQLRNVETNNAARATRRKLNLDLREAGLGIREKNLDTIAEDIALRFKDPPSVSLVQPIYAMGGLAPPELGPTKPVPTPPMSSGVPVPEPTGGAANPKPEPRPLMPPGLQAAIPKPQPTTPAKDLGDKFKAAEKTFLTPPGGTGGGGGATGGAAVGVITITPGKQVKVSTMRMKDFLIANADIVVIVRKSVKPKKGETVEQAVADYVNGLSSVNAIESLYKAVKKQPGAKRVT